MYDFILFKNSKGTTKLNLQLNESLDSLADLTKEQVIIINYMAIQNNYNFILSSELDLKAVTINEKSINLEYCKEVTSICKRVDKNERKSN